MLWHGLAGRCVDRLAAVVLAAGLLLFATAPAAAQALLTEAAARTAVEERYGVEVLRIESAEQDGVPVFLVRVMNPGGNFNEAFQVNTLVLDRRTGNLVPQFRHESSGVRDRSGTRRETDENTGPVLRRESVP